MKKLVFSILCLSLMFISCQAQADKMQNEDQTSTAQASVDSKINPENQVSGTPMQINTEEFIKLVHDFKSNPGWKFNGNKPCVVDFYADWCRPCKMMDPIMEKLAKEYDGKINFYKVNIDQNKELAQAYNISSIPFFLFCSINGQPQASMGMMAEEDLRKALDSILNQ